MLESFQEGDDLVFMVIAKPEIPECPWIYGLRILWLAVDSRDRSPKDKEGKLNSPRDHFANVYVAFTGTRVRGVLNSMPSR
jgi:hypothetical protein